MKPLLFSLVPAGRRLVGYVVLDKKTSKFRPLPEKREYERMFSPVFLIPNL
jgi:hypothetical protein